MSRGTELELDDIQSGMLRPRPTPYQATYVIFRIDDRKAGRELRLGNWRDRFLADARENAVYNDSCQGCWYFPSYRVSITLPALIVNANHRHESTLGVHYLHRTMDAL